MVTLFDRKIMKSNKQRRKEIKEKRLKKAQQCATEIDVYASKKIPEGAVLANRDVLTQHNDSPFIVYPKFYIDKAFTCKDCGSDETWTAEQQKRWYEIVGGRLEQIAIRCRPCRKKEKERKARARKIYLEGMEKKHQNI